MGRMIPGQARDVSVSHSREQESVGEWAAKCNRASQEDLLLTLSILSEQPIDVVADRLGITEDEVASALGGKIDLTMTELRLLAIASDLVISYSVRPARHDLLRLLPRVSWYEHREVGRTPSGAELSPLAYGRRAAQAV